MTRFRRAIKIVGPVRVASSNTTGVLLTVLVAWWVAAAPGGLEFPLMSPPNETSYSYAIIGGPYSRLPSTDPTQSTTLPEEVFDYARWSDWGAYRAVITNRAWRNVMESDTIGMEQSRHPPPRLCELPACTAEKVLCSIRERHFGYPRPAMGYIRRSTAASQLASGMAHVPTALAENLQLSPNSRHGGVVLPLRPILTGFLLDTLFYTAPVYTLLSIPACVSGLHRRLTNRCHRCGYHLDGLTADTCPECGHGFTRRARDDAARK
ncbi:MAG: hypothetical protein K8E66_04350 [Phycisphaerales bacterium]|nr:hypothetical protein [Phycisphaerales bacterium]